MKIKKIVLPLLSLMSMTASANTPDEGSFDQMYKHGLRLEACLGYLNLLDESSQNIIESRYKDKNNLEIAIDIDKKLNIRSQNLNPRDTQCLAKEAEKIGEALEELDFLLKEAEKESVTQKEIDVYDEDSLYQMRIDGKHFEAALAYLKLMKPAVKKLILEPDNIDFIIEVQDLNQKYTYTKDFLDGNRKVQKYLKEQEDKLYQTLFLFKTNQKKRLATEHVKTLTPSQKAHRGDVIVQKCDIKKMTQFWESPEKIAQKSVYAKFKASKTPLQVNKLKPIRKALFQNVREYPELFSTHKD